MSNPIVSIITPTISSRATHLQRLKKYIEAQTYDAFEWIVVTGESASIGEKRNKACEKARGQFIVNFDDDDYYAPTYIGDALAHLTSRKLDVTGVKEAYFANLAIRQSWLYEYRGKQPYVLGSGMMYKRSVWERNKYADISIGEDAVFVSNAGKVEAFDSKKLFFATLHGANTASHQAMHVFKNVKYSVFENTFKDCEAVKLL